MHVIENIDTFLSKERWLKGGWFNSQSRDARGRFTGKGVHTECLANFIRRVENAGHRTGRYVEREGSYASHTSITEKVVAAAIIHEFPRVTLRHLHITEKRWAEAGCPGTKINPDMCEASLDGRGGRCATCDTRRFKGEITVEVEYGGFGPDLDDVPVEELEGGEIIPGFNDTIGTTYEDVKRVIATARRIVMPSTSYADEVMTDQERIDIELQSIEAQRQVDRERVDRWLGEIEQAGWLNGITARKKAWSDKRKIDSIAKRDTEDVLRQDEDMDCVGCG